jgi:hypothetical protein
VQVHDESGRSGEKLTRTEAFDLVRRAVESLVVGDASTTASAARARAFELLGRNSESLARRSFERVLQDAHDANMIDLRRRGDDFEVARAAEAASIVEQMRVTEAAQKAAGQAQAGSAPATPRGMGARGIGGKAKGAPALPANLLMFGVVGATASPSALPAPEAASRPSEVAPPEPEKAAAGAQDAASEASEAPAKGGSRGRGAKSGKTATKAPTKSEAKAPAAKKVPAKTAPTAKPPAKKPVAKAPAKGATKRAKKNVAG